MENKSISEKCKEIKKGDKQVVVSCIANNCVVFYDKKTEVTYMTVPINELGVDEWEINDQRERLQSILQMLGNRGLLTADMYYARD